MRFAKALSSLLVVFVIATASAAALTACAPAEDDKSVGSDGFESGKGDGAYDVVDKGHIDYDAKTRVAVGTQVQAFRLESFGDTAIRIDAHGVSGADAYLYVEGPLDQDGDTTPAGAGAKFAEDDDSGPGRDARLKMTLSQPGVYRVLVGTYNSLGKGQTDDANVDVTVACTANCLRPMLSNKEFLKRLRDAGQLDLIINGFEDKISTAVTDAATRDLLLNQLHQIVATQDFDGLERFPTIPLAMIPKVRSMLGLIPSDPPAPDEVVTGELRDLIGDCAKGRVATLPPLNAAIPEVSMEDFPDRTLTACQYGEARGFAHVLTALAAGNGSSVSYKGETLSTPSELFEALMSHGHTIVVTNERMYANFLSFTYGDKNVQWPAWLETGVVLDDGVNLTIPMGHSQHAWAIRGPDVNTQVAFYLGVSGAGFFGKTTVRAAWSGLIARDRTSSADGDAGRGMIIATADAATTYFQRTRIERDTVAQGLPIDGYGFVGVCNDSNAIIEMATRGTLTTFPLLRAASLDNAPDLGDGLDNTVKSLPNDADVPTSDDDIERRVLEMTPHALDSALLPDDLLRSQLQKISHHVGQH